VSALSPQILAVLLQLGSPGDVWESADPAAMDPTGGGCDDDGDDDSEALTRAVAEFEALRDEIELELAASLSAFIYDKEPIELTEALLRKRMRLFELWETVCTAISSEGAPAETAPLTPDADEDLKLAARFERQSVRAVEAVIENGGSHPIDNEDDRLRAIVSGLQPAISLARRCVNMAMDRGEEEAAEELAEAVLFLAKRQLLTAQQALARRTQPTIS